MKLVEDLRGIVEKVLEKDQFLVDIVIKGAANFQKVILLVDSDSGMNISACASISRQVSADPELDSLFDGKYVLEVSSPGLDHPLRLERQYHKNLGRGMKVKRVDGQLLEGKLTKVDSDKIVLESQESESHHLAFVEIDSAMVVVSFKK